jgi:predicted enzyme related to lactoylglutathione lyase
MSDFVHLELATPDPAAAKTFYSKLFGWKMKDMPMENGTYTMFDTGGKGPMGGISGLMMPQQPTAWLGYIGVKSVKAAVAKAKSLGATVHVEYQEVPNMGAMAIMSDPTGAAIALWEPFMTAPPPKKAAPKKATKKVAARKATKKAAPKKAAKKTAKKKRA